MSYFGAVLVILLLKLLYFGAVISHIIAVMSYFCAVLVFGVDG